MGKMHSTMPGISGSVDCATNSGCLRASTTRALRAMHEEQAYAPVRRRVPG